ncbi:MAG: NAD(P)-dependent oxidoreductase [Bryobacterales bacterium]|nr:NAD(P)-dependent oxidoreductase [Bryobacterales bacterium]MDE0296717.1 NAD(P)-dependent oxidoreductase [Bryobacterales bacterium]
MKVGFVGLGIMGAPMAANLIGAGFALNVYNRTPGKCEALERLGAKAYPKPSKLASASEVVVTIVSDTPDVEAVLFGENGLVEGLEPGSVVIDMSTISPTRTVEFAARLADRQVDMLDAPVSGGDKGAIAGTLSIMVGGKQEAFNRCLPLFEAMGRNIVYAGSSGSGQKTKLVNQVVGSLNLLAMIEGLRMAEKAGLDPQRTLDAVGAGAAGSWMWTHLGPRVAQRDFAPGFMIRLHQKDLRLAAEFMRDLGIDMPGTALSHELFTEALHKGLGEQGNQGLYQLWES